MPMSKYSNWYTTNQNDHVEKAYDLCVKTNIKINNSEVEYEAIINDANEWQTDVDIIVLIKKTIYSGLIIGDVISFGNKNYLITFTPEDRDLFVSAKARLCTNTLKLYESNILYNIPCIVSDKISTSLETNKYLSTIDCDIAVMVANNVTNSLISPSDIFKIGRYNYFVTKPDDITKPGLIILPMKFAEEEQKILEYSIQILNGTNINIAQNQALTINVEILNNGVEVVPTPPLLFTSSDNAIATINNSGVVTILDIGTVVFTAKLQSDNTILDTITVQIEESQTDNYVVDITGALEVKMNKSVTLDAKVLKNGSVDATKSVVWSISNVDLSETNYVTITAQDGDSITIKSVKNFDYINKKIIVRATLSTDEDIYREHQIEVISLI